MKKKYRRVMSAMILFVLLLAVACSKAQPVGAEGEGAESGKVPAALAQTEQRPPKSAGPALSPQLTSGAFLADKSSSGMADPGEHPAIKEKLEYIKAAYMEPLEFVGAEDKSSATLYFTYRGVRLKFMYDFLGRLFAVEMSSEKTEDTAYRDLIVSTLFLDEIDLTQAEKEDFVMSLVITGRAQNGDLTGTYQGTTAWFSFQ